MATVAPTSHLSTMRDQPHPGFVLQSAARGLNSSISAVAPSAPVDISVVRTAGSGPLPMPFNKDIDLSSVRNVYHIQSGNTVDRQRLNAASAPVVEAPRAAASLTTSDVTLVDDPSLYSVSSIPVMQGLIPENLLPDELAVHDANDLTGFRGSSSAPVHYVRVEPKANKNYQYVYPVREPNDIHSPRRTGHLFLAAENRIVWGGHSTIFQAPFALALDGEFGMTPRARVIAKLPSPDCGSYRQLHHEARMYHAFPELLAQRHNQPLVLEPGATRNAHRASSSTDHNASPGASNVQARPTVENGNDSAPEKGKWKGLRRLFSKRSKSRKDAVGSSEAESPTPTEPATDARSSEDSKLFEFPPIVPKFYGYYLPVKADGSTWFQTHDDCDANDDCAVRWPLAILLMEDCGSPLQPCLFTREQRIQCFSLLKWLHDTGFVHAMPATDKMLVQPGPLSVPRAERSYANPSFRIVDFGRGDGYSVCQNASFWDEFQDWCDHDYECAWNELQMD